MGTKEQMVKIHQHAMKNQKKALIDKATQWLRNNLKDKRDRGVLTWQIIEDFKTYMDNYVHETRKQ